MRRFGCIGGAGSITREGNGVSIDQSQGGVLTWAGTAKDQPLNFSDLSGKEGAEPIIFHISFDIYHLAIFSNPLTKTSCSFEKTNVRRHQWPNDI